MSKLTAFINRAFYHGDYELMGHPAKKSMDSFAVQALIGTACMIFISGTFISGFLIELGAPDQLVNYMALVPSICGLFLFLFSPLVQRVVRPKKIGMIINGLAKFFLVSIMFVPHVVAPGAVLPTVVVFIVLGYSLNSLNNQIINNWFVQSIPLGIRGRYYSYRQIVAAVVNATLPLLAGAMVDLFEDKLQAFSVTAGIAAILAVCELLVFCRVPDCRLEVITEKLNILDTVRIPLQNRRFRKLLLYIGTFYLVLYLSGGMKQTYMLRYLELNYTFVNGMTVLSSVLQALVFWALWGKINDRLGPRFTLTLAIWFYALDAFIWFLVDEGAAAYVFIPLGNILGAVMGPAFTVGSFNYQYSIMPEKGRPMYSAFYTSFVGLVLFIAPSCGEFFKQLIEGSFLTRLLPHAGFRFTFLLSSVLLFAMQTIFILREKKINPTGVSLKSESYRLVLRQLLHRK